MAGKPVEGGVREDKVVEPVRLCGEGGKVRVTPVGVEAGGASAFEHVGGAIEAGERGVGPAGGEGGGTVAGAAAEVDDVLRGGEGDLRDEVAARAGAFFGELEIRSWLPGTHDASIIGETEGVAPRVAFFTDCFHEVNGVALTSRQLDAFAKRREYPFFSFHIGSETKTWTEGVHTTMEIARGERLLRLDADMFFDLEFLRYRTQATEAVRTFAPDVVHITGPGDCGILGVIAARELKIPLVASWHTDLHKYAGRRLVQMLEFLPDFVKEKLDLGAEKGALAATLQFYKLAKVTLAPNPDLVQMLEQGTGKPCFLMRRGIDSSIFSPSRRTRTDDDRTVVLGYVGRLSPEKGIRLLAEVERELEASGVTDYRFLIVGQGGEREWLGENLKRVEFAGVLRGEELATAYANMDLFLFPSRTDTFGNVIQEALASGVPAVVFAEGGPKFLVEPGETGARAETDEEFVRETVRLTRDEAQRTRLRASVLASKLDRTWDGVFEDVYAAYRQAL